MSSAAESIKSDAECEAYFNEVIKEAERGEILWHDCTVHHLLNKLGKGYTNILVQTSKLHSMHKVEISSQFWILNELMYPLDAVFAEGNFNYDPISLPSLYDDPTINIQPRILGVNLEAPNSFLMDGSQQVTGGPGHRSMGELIPLPNDKLDQFLSFQAFHGHSKKDKNLLLAKHNSIQTFTGTPFDNNKSKKRV